MTARVEPQPRRKLVPDQVLGVGIFVFTEIMLFTGFISAHAIVEQRAPMGLWPPLDQPTLPAWETALNTAVLVLSGLALLIAQRQFGRDTTKAARWIGASIVLGAFFVGFQGVEWIALISQGLTLTTSTHGAFFYLLVGTHGLHAVGALGALIWAWRRAQRGALASETFMATQLLWYFVVLIWPFIYVRVYV